MTQATKKRRKACDSCQAAMINGVFCHEIGCPNKRTEKECKNCGQKFRTKNPQRLVCSKSCWRMYYGR